MYIYFFSEYNERLQKEVSNESFFVSPPCNYTVAVTASNIYSLYPGACTLTYFLFYTLEKKKEEIEYISANTHTAFFLMYFYNYQAEVSL